MEKIKGILEEFKKLEEVEAIALGGSRAIGCNDEKSDYDLYIYIKEEIKINIRENIIKKYSSYEEINNSYWEIEDDFKLKDGTVVEIIYRSIDDFKKGLESVVIKGNPSSGYTTCMWNNLLNCKILFDKEGKLENLKKEFNIKYPKELRDNIIKKNRELLSGKIPSYYDQIKKAIERQDVVSINHRITEFLGSYFDIIFAFNYKTHPGEKRLVENCIKCCHKLPKNFENNIIDLLSISIEYIINKSNNINALNILDSIIKNLDYLLNEEEFLI